jgi:hypothetical protein
MVVAGETLVFANIGAQLVRQILAKERRNGWR